MSFRNMLIINKPLESPGFKHYFMLSFFTAVFFIVQDGLYRSESLLGHMRLWNLTENIIVFAGLACYFFIMLGIGFFFLDLLYVGINNFFVRASYKKQGVETWDTQIYCRISNFLFFAVNVYIFLIYFKLFSNTLLTSWHFNDPVNKSTLVTLTILAALIINYFFYLRFKFDHKRITRLTEKIFPYTTLLVLILWLASIMISTDFTLKGKPSETTSANRKKPHILLITADGMKYGSMFSSGNKRNLTPNIKKFAGKANLFTHNISYSNGTPVCLSTIELGSISPNGPVTESLSYILGENGYNTRIFASQFSGVSVGYYTDHISLNEPCNYTQLLKEEALTSFSSWVQRLYSEDERFYNIFSSVDPREIDYMWKNPDTENHLRSIVYAMKKSPTPTFVWLHMLETHIPFHYPEYFDRYRGGPYAELDKYDNSILYFDYLFKELMEQLQKEKLDENTIVIFSSDHGIRQIPQEAYPSFTYTSLRFLNSVYHTPLIIKFPGQQKGNVFRNFTSSLDLRLTLLDYLGINDVSAGNGESLMPLIKGEVNSTGLKASVSQVYVINPQNRDPGKTNVCEDVLGVYWKNYVIMLYKNLQPNSPSWKELYAQALENNTNTPYPCVLYKEPGLSKVQVEDEEPIPFRGFMCLGIFDVSKGWKSDKNLLHSDEGRKILKEIDTPSFDEMLRIPLSRL